MILPRRGGRADAFRAVFRFVFAHWGRQKLLIAGIAAAVAVSTATDILLPLFAGRLVDAVALDAGERDAALNAALWALGAITGLGALAILMRHIAFIGIVRMTLRMMADVAADAFHRVQRFSTDWHANNFA